ncbi:MAG: hypothetical protein ABWX90_03160 [Candidatus Saccharimonadales bacterium]
MWGLRLIMPFERLSIRNVLLFVATMLVAIFAYTFASAPNTYAADASWSGNAISYNGNQYIKVADETTQDSTNLPNGIHYVYIDGQQTAHVLSFPAGADLANVTSADYSEYNFVPPGDYRNKSNSKTVSIEAQTNANQGTNSCDSTFTAGIGWIVCPVTNFLAGAMDWLFQILTGFLTVRPAQTNSDNALYRAWSVMRNFANIAFVIGFLIIIYSQLTSMGISNYGIKKILPRLIIAAILVNVSYWVCAIAIDVSNILGYSLQDIFINLRNTIIGTEGNSWDVVSWQSVGGFILSGGTAAVALGVGAHALAASTAGPAIYMLIPILVGVLMAVLVALLIMAARQAIITVLVILAPLAFVAYLLPNTEKYFDKWRSLFMTMLLLFPVFSVLFGGAQLAGIAIIQNADSINLIILGMAVQVAPVVLTPFLIKFSGSLLGRIAGMVNNPNRGAIDRTRKWATERAGQSKDRALGKKNPGFMARRAQSINAKRRGREDWQKVNQSRADNIYRGMDDYAAVDDATREAGRAKQILDNSFESNWNIKANIDTSSIKKELELQLSTDEASRSKERVSAMQKEFQAGKMPDALPLGVQQSASMVNMINQSQDTARDLALTAMRKQSAEGIHKSQIAKALLQNTDTIDGKALQDYAGGIDEHGANSALATAVSIDRKQYGERVAEASAILKHFNISGKDRQDHAMGNRTVTLTDSAGNVKTLDNDSTFTREAALEAQLAGAGNMDNIEEIIMNSGGKLSEFRTTISEGIVKNGISGKGVYWGGKTIDEVAQGNINGIQDVEAVVTRAIAQGKIKPATLATMDQTAIKRILASFKQPNLSRLSPEDAATLNTEMSKLQASAYEAMTSDNLRGNVAQNVQPLLREIIGDYTPPTVE